MTPTLIAAFVTFFVVVDPIGLAPMFAALTPAHTPLERRLVAGRSVLIAAGVLTAFALIGKPVLGSLGVELPALRIAGGVLLLLLSIDMVMARQSGLRATTPPEDAESGDRHDISVFPLAIPLIAGPGAITSVVLLMSGGEGDPLLQAAILAVLGGVLIATFAAFVLAGWMVSVLGVTGINVVSRVMGILLAALSIQFIIDGVGDVVRAF